MPTPIRPVKDSQPNPIPVCPLHTMFMLPHSEVITLHVPHGVTSCFKCPNRDCLLVYFFGAREGYYTVERDGAFKRYLGP